MRLLLIAAYFLISATYAFGVEVITEFKSGDITEGIAAADTGDFYIFGLKIATFANGDNGHRITIKKFKASGNLEWQRNFERDFYSRDVALHGKVDSQGDLILQARYRGQLSFLKIDAQSNLDWNYRVLGVPVAGRTFDIKEDDSIIVLSRVGDNSDGCLLYTSPSPRDRG